MANEEDRNWYGTVKTLSAIFLNLSQVVTNSASLARLLIAYQNQNEKGNDDTNATRMEEYDKEPQFFKFLNVLLILLLEIHLVLILVLLYQGCTNVLPRDDKADIKRRHLRISNDLVLYGSITVLILQSMIAAFTEPVAATFDP